MGYQLIEFYIPSYPVTVVFKRARNSTLDPFPVGEDNTDRNSWEIFSNRNEVCIFSYFRVRR